MKAVIEAAALAIDIDRLRANLGTALAKEKKAIARLRRAQTLYDKYYDRRSRLQEQISDAYDQADRIAQRLTTTEKKEK